MEHEIIPTNRKALKINIDTNFYGSFAEIGGGQEVARYFFQAGGSSRTVAKSISAYDKSFSDELYNKGNQGRYVSEDRLLKMLHEEYSQLTNVLEKTSSESKFFAFADTFEILNFAKTNQGHGWMGVKFQLTPDGQVNTVLLNVKLLENDGLLQQRTVGTLGVNLLYACINYYEHPNVFLLSLLDNLSKDRLRITMIRMEGADLEYVDNRLLAVQLVKNGMTHAIMFDKDGNVAPPSDMLYKKNVLVLRGSFRPITNIALDILNRSMNLFQLDEDYEPDNTLSFCELTLNAISHEGIIDEKDFLERVNMLNDIGQNVMVSDLKEFYKLVSFFSQFALKQLRIIIGVPTLEKVLDKKYYEDLNGGILEALGYMFPKDTKMYIYPTMKKGSENIFNSKNINLEKDVAILYEYLLNNRFILDIQTSMMKELYIKSHEVLQMIKDDNKDWIRYVPISTAKTIKERKLFRE
ncbi:MAG: hypothetical protein AUJ98_11755 [Bacteroidetes bacterium CG2_30_33_31]|nr:MAG: hypothetical protein AUJ98_11755 [Bacteroidetes bacterium CG2_30_33_31]